MVIEILDRNTLAVYKNTAEAVDYILRGWPIRPEIRKVDKTYDAEPKQAEKHEPAISDIPGEINKLEQKIQPEHNTDSLKFSFSRQKYVEEVKGFKKYICTPFQEQLLKK